MPQLSELPVFRHRLANGLELAVIPDPACPAVALNLGFRVGSVDETPGRTGFAHLFEHLMFQGSQQVAPGEHFAAIEAAGGSVNAYTSTDRTVYHETVPPGVSDLILWLEADRLRSLAVTQSNLDAQRDVVFQEKAQRYDNRPYGDMLQALVSQHFSPTHPYGHLPIGSMTDLEAATLSEVTSFHARWYRPSQARLVLAGAITPERAVELVERYFADLPGGPKPQRAEITEPPLPGSAQTLQRDVPHQLVLRSWLGPSHVDPNHLCLDLGIAVLTHGHASRLHRRLVKELGVAREVHGMILPHLRCESIATIMTRPSDGTSTQECLALVDQELAAFDGPSEEELARVKAQYERDWLEQLATAEGRAEAAALAWNLREDPAAINQVLDELRAVTAEDVARVMNQRPSQSELHYLPRTQS